MIHIIFLKLVAAPNTNIAGFNIGTQSIADEITSLANAINSTLMTAYSCRETKNKNTEISSALVPFYTSMNKMHMNLTIG